MHKYIYILTHDVYLLVQFLLVYKVIYIYIHERERDTHGTFSSMLQPREFILRVFAKPEAKLFLRIPMV